jgi:pantetheine-phosphate adenylyltransferase
MTKAVYAGSFDPLTVGHLWMVEQGAALFDRLVLAIGVHPDKKYAFTLQERRDMLREAVRPFRNVRVDSFENRLLVHYARSVGAGFMLRGIRSEGDYEYERAMRHVNGDLAPRISTVFLMPPREIAEVSSSFVKGLVGLAGWRSIVKKYLPPPVFRRFAEKFGR